MAAGEQLPFAVFGMCCAPDLPAGGITICADCLSCSLGASQIAVAYSNTALAVM